MPVAKARAVDWPVIGLLAVAGILLLAGLDNGLLWQDEAETALLARRILQFGYPRAYDGLNYIEIEPFGYGPAQAWIYSPWLPFYVLAGTFFLLGQATWVARLPFAIFGWVTVLLTWRLACHLTAQRRIQRLSVALLTCSVPFLLHMRQCRYYAMATMLLTAVCLLYLRFLAQPTRGRAAALSVVLVLLFHTNFGTFIPTFAALFAHQAGWGTRPAGRRFLLGAAGVVACTFPWVLFAYRPAFVGAFRLERLYDHLEYYVRVTNKYLVPVGFMALASLAIWAAGRRVRPGALRAPSAAGWALVLMGLLHVAFLALPDQRHMRYLMPAVPLFVIGEAWWLVRWWLQGRLRLAGWVVAGLALFSNVLQSPAWAVPLVDVADELTHPYVGPMEGVVGLLRREGKPGQTVKIAYDDRTILFYTELKVTRPSEFVRETYPDWIVIRRGWTPKHFFRGAHFRRIEATYDRLELDAPDAFWQNREDPGLHHFRRAWWPRPVVVYRKRRG